MIRLFYPILFGIFLLVISVYYIDPRSYYFYHPWLDIPMHITGGFSLGWLAVECKKYFSLQYGFATVIMFALGVALSWELYEYLQDIMVQGYWDNGIADTLKDIVLGVGGASVGAYIVNKFYEYY